MALSLSRGFASDQKAAILSVFWLVIIAGLCGIALSADLSKLSLSGKLANQSTTWDKYNAHASRAIDGNASPIWRRQSCTHTELSKDPWWMVDLAVTTCLGKIVLVNRGDCCNHVLAGAVVRAGLNASFSQNAICGSPVTSAQASIPGAHLNFICDPPRPARYVSVHSKGRSTVLTLCEVFVYEHTNNRHLSGEFHLIREGGCAEMAHTLATVLAKSLLRCTARCQRNVECRYVDYAPATGRCRLYAQRAVAWGPDAGPLCQEYAVAGRVAAAGSPCDNPM